MAHFNGGRFVLDGSERVTDGADVGDHVVARDRLDDAGQGLVTRSLDVLVSVRKQTDELVDEHRVVIRQVLNPSVL